MITETPRPGEGELSGGLPAGSLRPQPTPPHEPRHLRQPLLTPQGTGDESDGCLVLTTGICFFAGFCCVIPWVFNYAMVINSKNRDLHHVALAEMVLFLVCGVVWSLVIGALLFTFLVYYLIRTYSN